nr:hypothetical protein GCM10020092_105540 [Actinoplanes digitatis]
MIASPQASNATSAMISTVPCAKASATQIPAWASPAVISSSRLSTRSAIRPVIGASTARGSAAASSSPETARPPALGRLQGERERGRREEVTADGDAARPPPPGRRRPIANRQM